MPDGAQSNEGGLQNTAAVKWLIQSGQWFNLSEMKRISTTLSTAFSNSRRGYRRGASAWSPFYMSNHKSELITSLRRHCKGGQRMNAGGQVDRPTDDLLQT